MELIYNGTQEDKYVGEGFALFKSEDSYRLDLIYELDDIGNRMIFKKKVDISTEVLVKLLEKIKIANLTNYRDFVGCIRLAENLEVEILASENFIETIFYIKLGNISIEQDCLIYKSDSKELEDILKESLNEGN